MALKRHGAWAGAAATVAAAGLAFGLSLRMADPVRSNGVELASASAEAELAVGLAASETRVLEASQRPAAVANTGLVAAGPSVDVRRDDSNTVGAGEMRLAEATEISPGAVALLRAGGERALASGAGTPSADVLRSALAQVAMVVREELGATAGVDDLGNGGTTGIAMVDFSADALVGDVLPERLFAAASEAVLPVADDSRQQRLLSGWRTRLTTECGRGSLWRRCVTT